MIKTNELRVGNWIYSKVYNKPMQVSGVYNNGDIDITKDIDPIDRREESKNFEPLLLNDEVISILESRSLLVREKNLFYFPGNRTTFFLVHLEDETNFLIGMIDTDLPEGYRRITRPFTEMHKLQNAYFMIYDKEFNCNCFR